MISESSAFRGFNINNPSVSQATFNNQMNSYIKFSGWTAGTVPSIGVAPIYSTTGGLDIYGNPILAYTFQTYKVLSSVLQPTDVAWYTWLVSTGATNGQKYSTISNNTNSNPFALTSRVMNSTYYDLVVNYTGNTGIPNGVYRVYSTYGNTDFNIQNLGFDLYFRGGNLI
jgi:hypothetical protein